MTGELPDHATLYRALSERNPLHDGQVWVCVSSTGIFCRLTCPSRTPKPENCTFRASTDDCLAAGFRACKRCRPLGPMQVDAAPQSRGRRPPGR